MKRKGYNCTMAADYKKCSVVNFAPSCFVIDIFFLVLLLSFRLERLFFVY